MDNYSTVKVVGHSFVRRLSDWINRQENPALWSSLGLQDNFSVDFVASTRNGKNLGYLHIIEAEFDRYPWVLASCNVLLLDIGTNDLHSYYINNPERLALLVFQFARRCVETWGGPSKVVIFSILERHGLGALPRQRGRRRGYSEAAALQHANVFNGRVRQYNNRLQTLCSPSNSIHFRKMRGFQRNQKQKLCSDGVHLLERYTRKYWNGLKSACIHHLQPLEHY